MSKQHELLAVESDLKNRFGNILAETGDVFKSKANVFQGSVKTTEMFDENAPAVPAVHQELTTTVDDKLAYAGKFIGQYFDALAQKEATNQVAKADLVVDGEVLVKDAPATFLLALEGQLKEVRTMYAKMPTLQVGVKWEKDETAGKGVYRQANPEQKTKTAKQFQFQVLYEATKEHPAQIERWEEQVPVGTITENKMSGAVSSARKSELLDRIDTLIQAVKKARQKANTTDVVKINPGKAIVDFINK